MGRTSTAKSQLVQSAKELLFSRSYASVGVNELCKHAGVKKGSFYHYFDSKRELTLETLNRQWEETTKVILEKAFIQGSPPLKQIELFFEGIVETFKDYYDKTGKVPGCPFGNLASELSMQDEVVRQKIDCIFQECVRYFENALLEAKENGEINTHDPGTTAYAMVAYLQGIILLAKTRNDIDLLTDLGKKVMKLV